MPSQTASVAALVCACVLLAVWLKARRKSSKNTFLIYPYYDWDDGYRGDPYALSEDCPRVKYSTTQ